MDVSPQKSGGVALINAESHTEDDESRDKALAAKATAETKAPAACNFSIAKPEAANPGTSTAAPGGLSISTIDPG